jgi:malate/lactate dehydrogenase/phosphoglycolate phosphatase-like HAD superfamily hydrolase
VTKFIETNKVVELFINFYDNLYETLFYFRQLIGVEMEEKLIPQKPKVIFFDLSSTILDSHAVDIEAIDFILTKYGVPKWDEGTREKKEKGKSMKDNFPNFFGINNAEKAYSEYLKYIIDNIERMPLIMNSIEMIKYCKQNGIKTIIVSNRDKIFVDVFIKKFEIETLFDGIITPDDMGFTKPDPRILTSSFEKFGLDPTRDTILFMGDAFADVRCAFRSGCIPILYTEIVRDEISPKNLERLKKINPENPVREVKSQKQFINMLEDSKHLWQNKKATKITYIGANGKIGKEAISMICSKIPDNENVEVVLVGSGSKESLTRLDGFVKDVTGSLSLQGKKSKIKFVITNNYCQTKDSDIVLCSAGKWPTEFDREKYKSCDSSGRLIQSFVNAEMIINITEQLKEYCPNALFVIVTNQVDMMCCISRQVAPNMEIIGLSGGVDSSRLKQITKEILGLDCDGLMIGFHNVNMTPLTKSLKTEDGQTIFPLMAKEEEFSDEELQEEFLSIEQKKFNTVISTVRTLGGKISAEQKTGLTDGKDTGASVLPATALSQLVSGYCFDVPFVESYNVFIDNPKTAHHFGVQQNTALSVPLVVTKGKIEISTEIQLLESEKVRMREAQYSLNKDLELLGYKCITKHKEKD